MSQNNLEFKQKKSSKSGFLIQKEILWYFVENLNGITEMLKKQSIALGFVLKNNVDQIKRYWLEQNANKTHEGKIDKTWCSWGENCA